MCMQNVQRYQQLAGGSEQLESQLPDSLPEYINAEVVLRTIKDTSTALAWLKSTFLFVRVCDLAQICRVLGSWVCLETCM